MEINLLKKYPKTKRNLKKRTEEKSSDVIKIARKFGRDFLMGIENMDMVDLIMIKNIGEKLRKI